MRLALALALAFCVAAVADAYEAIRTPTTHYHYDIGVAAIEENAFARAIENLKLVVRDEPRNADAHDWLGYAYARDGQPEPAMRHVKEALRLDPKHRRAHQHLGELWLARGDAKRARETLAALKKLCAGACEEAVALEQAIAAGR